ncbi:hypothetical protein PB1_01590 [Bacillus methanolicus PB1]|uniref:Uncharacterized protein n=1 Tax=Bacillus methanolicus PB1 TaxID=997296 RepID=I3E524_BACMT|nr:hypothetical protein PB1_01590 [Bacillus methanolicus PB1]
MQSYVKKLTLEIIVFKNVTNFLFQDIKFLNEKSFTYDFAMKAERIKSNFGHGL